MSERSLLMLISRIEGANEWAEVWKFPVDDMIAFIRAGKATSHGPKEFQSLDLNAQLDADVWVINGYSHEGPRRNLLYARLNEIDWKARSVILMVHRGGAQYVDSADFKRTVEKIEYPNTRALLGQALNYSIGNTNAPDHPFVRFARGLRETISESEYRKRLEALTAPPPPTPLFMKIANTIHHLSYVLHPLDIDFQGLLDTDFQLDYWQEVVADYQNGKALGKLQQARNLIYGEARSPYESAASVMAEADRRFETGAWLTSWQELQTDQLPRSEGPQDIQTILTQMQAGSIDLVKAHFTDGKNPIHEWVTKINKSLGEIRDALSAREGESKT